MRRVTFSTEVLSDSGALLPVERGLCDAAPRAARATRETRDGAGQPITTSLIYIRDQRVNRTRAKEAQDVVKVKYRPCIASSHSLGSTFHCLYLSLSPFISPSFSLSLSLSYLFIYLFIAPSFYLSLYLVSLSFSNYFYREFALSL